MALEDIPPGSHWLPELICSLETRLKQLERELAVADRPDDLTATDPEQPADRAQVPESGVRSLSTDGATVTHDYDGTDPVDDLPWQYYAVELAQHLRVGCGDALAASALELVDVSDRAVGSKEREGIRYLLRVLPSPLNAPREADAVTPEPAKTKGGSNRPTRDLMIAALSNHHGYENNGTCTNWEPAVGRELKRQLNISTGAVSGFFKVAFGSHQKYRVQCHNKSIGKSLQILNGDLSPRLLNAPDRSTVQPFTQKK